MTPSSTTLSGLRRVELLILLGSLQAIAPVSIDLYLPAMPTMERVFGVTAADIQTTMVTYLFGFALAQTLYGPLTDRFGRKPPLYYSLGLFAVSSAACAFAPSIPVIAGLRLLQAIGACGGSVIARAIVRDIFPPSELRRVFSVLILMARGQLDRALHIRQEEELPVYKRLGDIRERAVTEGKIAIIFLTQGKLNEADQTMEAGIQLLEQVEDRRSLVMARTYWAVIQARLERKLEACRLLRLAHDEAMRMRLPVAGRIREMIQDLGC